jgi:hypothetical protein
MHTHTQRRKHAGTRTHAHASSRTRARTPMHALAYASERTHTSVAATAKGLLLSQRQGSSPAVPRATRTQARTGEDRAASYMGAQHPGKDGAASYVGAQHPARPLCRSAGRQTQGRAPYGRHKAAPLTSDTRPRPLRQTQGRAPYGRHKAAPLTSDTRPRP